MKEIGMCSEQKEYILLILHVVISWEYLNIFATVRLNMVYLYKKETYETNRQRNNKRRGMAHF